MNKKIFLIAFFILIALPFFLFLGRDSIQIWDEARNTLNLYEMYKSGNFLVTTYQGEPEMWNTKPPLLHWVQLFFVNIFGFNELAIRLPSAISGFLTCVALWYFIKKYTKNVILASCSAFVLATSNGFIDIHSSRTGDYDSLMVLFATIASLSLFTYIDKKNNKYLYFFFVSLALGVLTKSIAILLLLPAFGIFILFDKQVLFFLKNKHFYIGIIIFICIISSFYLLRESQNPGYLKAVLENEILGRYTEGLEGNRRPFNFYFENFKTRFSWWLFFVPIGILAGFLNRNIKYVRITIYSLIIVASHFLIISSAETKLLWYELPEYPFLSIIVGVGLYTIYEFFKNNSTSAITFFNNPKYKKPLIVLFFVIIMVFPYYKIIAKISIDRQEEYYRNNQIIPRYLKEVLYETRNIEKDVCVCVSMLNHHYHTEYYINRLQEKGINIRFCNWKNIKEGQIILVGHDDELKSIIESHYEYEILETHQSDWNYWGIKKYRILKQIKEFQGEKRTNYLTKNLGDISISDGHSAVTLIDNEESLMIHPGSSIPTIVSFNFDENHNELSFTTTFNNKESIVKECNPEKDGEVYLSIFSNDSLINKLYITHKEDTTINLDISKHKKISLAVDKGKNEDYCDWFKITNFQLK